MSDFEKSDTEGDVDGFEVRAEFKELLSTVHQTSRDTIGRITQFVFKDGYRNHSRIMYECIRERTLETKPLNRLPFLYIIDSICQQSIKTRRLKSWIPLVSADLSDIALEVVPDNEPVNAGAMKKCITAWRRKAVFPDEILDGIEPRIDELLVKSQSMAMAPMERTFSHKEIMRRIEEDRDRHKRAREEGWLVPDPDSDDIGLPKPKKSKRDGSTLRTAIVARDEFSECWEKIPTPTEDDHEWHSMNDDLARFNAEHPGY